MDVRRLSGASPLPPGGESCGRVRVLQIITAGGRQPVGSIYIYGEASRPIWTTNTTTRRHIIIITHSVYLCTRIRMYIVVDTRFTRTMPVAPAICHKFYNDRNNNNNLAAAVVSRTTRSSHYVFVSGRSPRR